MQTDYLAKKYLSRHTLGSKVFEFLAFPWWRCAFIYNSTVIFNNIPINYSTHFYGYFMLKILSQVAITPDVASTNNRFEITKMVYNVHGLFYGHLQLAKHEQDRKNNITERGHLGTMSRLNVLSSSVQNISQEN